MSIKIIINGIFIFLSLSYSTYGLTIALTSTNLGDPTQAELQAGYTVDNYGGVTDLSLTIQATGNHDTLISPNISGTQFSNSMPTVNATSEPGYTFTFDGHGVVDVIGLELGSNNNIFSRNISSTGFQARERANFSIAGGVWDTVSGNGGGNTGQLQINGIGLNAGSVSINLPTTAVAQYNTNGFTATASGSSITELVYYYDFPTVTNGGQAPSGVETNQPFFWK